jgi:hypothetical protein
MSRKHLKHSETSQKSAMQLQTGFFKYYHWAGQCNGNLHSGGAWSKYLPGHWLLWQRFPVVLSVPIGKCWHNASIRPWLLLSKSFSIHQLSFQTSTMDHWRSRCKGWILWPTPHSFIHTYINYISFQTMLYSLRYWQCCQMNMQEMKICFWNCIQNETIYWKRQQRN